MSKTYRISETQFEKIISKKQIYNNGYKANRSSEGLEKNPHEKGTSEYESWKDGWLSAEAKSQANHDDAEFKKEIGESENTVSEVREADTIYTKSLNKGEIDFMFDVNKLFPNIAKPGVKNSAIIVDGTEYDAYINGNSAIIKYGIDVDMNEFGIKDVVLHPISVSLTGVIEFWGDENDFEKEFELVFDRSGLKENSLSGPTDLGGKIVEIGSLGSEVTLTSERINSGSSFYVSDIDVSLLPNMIVFNY